MTETIVSKRCSKCGTDKPFTDFFKDNRPGKSGFKSQCKPCHMAGCQNGYKERMDRYYAKNRCGDKVRARHTVNNRVRQGRLPKATSQKCTCGKQAQHYHHHRGYDRKCWDDVVAVCAECHKKHDLP